MKTSRFAIIAVAALFVLILPLAAQRPAAEDRPAGGGVERSGPADSGSSGVTSRGISAGDFSGSSAPTGRIGGDFAGTPSAGSVTGGSGGYAAPNLTGTSFYSANSYYEWQSFLWQLQSRYLLDRSYFTRFVRNQEPLVTPQLLKLALREPISLSGRLVRSSGELEDLITRLQAGTPVSKQDIALKTREIRDLAKKIRQDNSLSYVEQRLDRNLTKEDGDDHPRLEAVRELREIANDLHTQLKGMYTQTSTATVSVHTLVQPSFEVLSRKIERLSKVIDSAMKRS